MESKSGSGNSQFTVEELNTIHAGLIIADNCLGKEEFYLKDNIKSVVAKNRRSVETSVNSLQHQKCLFVSRKMSTIIIHLLIILQHITIPNAD
ncbi:MAG TPA: hypothetical protein VH500_14095 [Nitrososphaeraceae archaeon]|jgi:hypothetical protein